MTDQNSTLTKVCTKCGSEKEATPENFYSSKRGLFGLKSACKTCEDFKACWALENLQPLWAKDNLSKGAKYDPS